MQKVSILFLVFFFRHFFILAGTIERNQMAENYIKSYKNDAVKEMLMYKIPASITLAQGMLESRFGTSDLAKFANNHFGIKCHMEWEGPVFIKDDDKKDECFRKYETVLDSYTDHSNFLKTRQRYASLFELNHTDYKGWAKGLKAAGYATDPKYERQLLELIESYKLYEFDILDNSQTISNNFINTQTEKKQNTTSSKKSNEKETITPREILQDGIVKYIIIKPTDTFEKIASETDKDLWQLYKYNDLSANDKLVSGQKLYLQPKHNKAKEPFHIVSKGETMKSISQLHGIKLKALYKKNNMKPGEEPKVGETLFLRKSKPADSF